MRCGIVSEAIVRRKLMVRWWDVCGTRFVKEGRMRRKDGKGLTVQFKEEMMQYFKGSDRLYGRANEPVLP